MILYKYKDSIFIENIRLKRVISYFLRKLICIYLRVFIYSIHIYYCIYCEMKNISYINMKNRNDCMLSKNIKFFKNYTKGVNKGVAFLNFQDDFLHKNYFII